MSGRTRVSMRVLCMHELPACLGSTHTCPGGPAVLTFLLCMRDLEHRHEAALGASGVCGITLEGS